ncbi:MAG: penicillin acylase family protein [Solirubrobacterales bacterium]
MGIDPSRLLKAGLAGLGLGGALFGASAAGAWWQLFHRPQPKTEGGMRVRGIDGPVEIARDRWGMPRVRAADRHDLWFGLGFVHGQDRLWQCELHRRVVSGRLSEMAGRDGLPVDRFMRTVGMRRAAEREVSELDPEVLAMLEAYCAGLNEAGRTMTTPPAELQIMRLGVEPFRPVDCLAGGKLFAFGMSVNWERELLRADLVRELGPGRAARLDPPYPRGNPVITAPGAGYEGDGLALAGQIGRVRELIGLPAGATGSNNWAVSGARSATGVPLIAGDPHLPSSMPGFIYEVALELGDRFCRGGTIPGIPTVFFGQNNDVCWTFTNVLADCQDLFVERVNAEDGTYLFRDEWRPLEVVEEEIRVRGSDEPVPITVRSTHHGPIVNDQLGTDPDPPLALRWTALDAPSVSPAHFEVLDPRSGPELVEMLRPVAMPVVNLIWADRESIGYKLVGHLPKRAGDCPDLPKPGWTGEFEWEGLVPYEELPELNDPEDGYLVTANNRVAGPDFPHHISSDYLDGYRAARIEQLLLASDEHDLDGFARMQTDLHSIPGAEVARRLARLEAPGQRETRAIERLRSWDGELGPESVAASIYQAFVLRLSREFARAAIGDRDLAERYLDRADNGFLAHVTSPWRWHSHLLALWEEGDHELIGRPWDELALEALRGALDDLEGRFGPEPERWRWGTVHELRFPHALGEVNPAFDWAFNRSLRVGGGQETVTQVAYDPNDPYEAIWAPAWRMVADPGDPDRSGWQLFTGQSGHAMSAHYDDLQPRWLAGQLQPMRGEGPWKTLSLAPEA